MNQLSEEKIQELFINILPLTSSQREDVLNRAFAQVKAYLSPPKRADYVDTVISEYPSWLRRAMFIALIVLLIASATPSFFRMVHAGATYFKHGINDDVQAVLVGFSIFLMAEIMLVLVGISRQVLFKNNPVSKQISLLVMGLAFSLSLVGNWTVARPYDLFGWLETVTPPVATIAIAMILEGLILDNIKARHSNEMSYQQALIEYRQLINDPKQHPRWQNIYHGQMKDMLIRVNSQGVGSTARKQILSGLTPIHWSYLISREYALENQGSNIIHLTSDQVIGTSYSGKLSGSSVHSVHEQKQVNIVYDEHEHEREHKQKQVNTNTKSSAWIKVEQFLKENPKTTMTYREIAEHLNVSIGLISKVRNSMLATD